uniref:FLYWCH-type domain-containing protein n=1 Tax=Toxocara canis TaxID=6265 RepID=A0A183UUA7_TOXCA
MSNGELESELCIRGEQTESTNEFIYLCTCVKVREGTPVGEQCRIKRRWKAFFKNKGLYYEKKKCQQRELFDKSGQPAVETWATIGEAHIPLAMADRRMESIITGTKVINRGTTRLPSHQKLFDGVATYLRLTHEILLPIGDPLRLSKIRSQHGRYPIWSMCSLNRATTESPRRVKFEPDASCTLPQA